MEVLFIHYAIIPARGMGCSLEIALLVPSRLLHFVEIPQISPQTLNPKP